MPRLARNFQQTEVTYEYDDLLLSSTLKKSFQCICLKFIPKLRPFNLTPEITCPLNTLDIFDVFLITPQSFLARLNLLINLPELMRYSNSLHTYSSVQVDSVCTEFVPACSTFLIEHLEAAGLHRGSVKAAIFLEDNTHDFHAQISPFPLRSSFFFLPETEYFGWVKLLAD
jgi:hypothetical protein